MYHAPEENGIARIVTNIDLKEQMILTTSVAGVVFQPVPFLTLQVVNGWVFPHRRGTTQGEYAQETFCTSAITQEPA